MSLGFKLGRSDKLWTLLSLPSSTIFAYIRWLVPGDPYLTLAELTRNLLQVASTKATPQVTCAFQKIKWQLEVAVGFTGDWLQCYFVQGYSWDVGCYAWRSSRLEHSINQTNILAHRESYYYKVEALGVFFWLHRDIGAGNIIIYNGGGLLIDWDMWKDLDWAPGTHHKSISRTVWLYLFYLRLSRLLLFWLSEYR